jgi:hypothetical protein
MALCSVKAQGQLYLLPLLLHGFLAAHFVLAVITLLVSYIEISCKEMNR